MEFDVETDPDTMFELFGDDYVCFAEYVSILSLEKIVFYAGYRLHI